MFGEASFESKKRNVFKIKDGDNVYRILPPFGSLSSKGKWFQYHSVVWGYNDSSGRKKPFLDCRVFNFRTKMVEVESPAYQRAEKLKAKLEEMKKAKKEGASISEDAIKQMTEMVRKYNIDNKYYLNVINLQGEVGALKIGKRAKELLESEMKKLDAKGVNPISLENGRFFNIFRTGMGNNTVYQVTVYKENFTLPDGEVVEKDKVHKIDGNVIAKLATEVWDLGTMYLHSNFEQVQRIVDGEPVDLVLGSGDTPSEEDQESAPMEAVAPKEAQPAPTPKSEPIAPIIEAPPVKAPPVEAKPAPAEQPQTPQAKSDEEWLKEMGM